MLYSGGGLLVLILDIYCLYLIVNSSMASDKKLIWALVVILLPLLGPILFLLMGQGA